MSEHSRQAAIEQARRVVSAHPGQPLFWVELANRLRLNDEFAEALSWARWAVRAEMWPEQEVDTRAWTLLGHLFSMWAGLIRLSWLTNADAGSTARPGRPWGQGNWPQRLGDGREALDGKRHGEESPPPPYFQGWPQATALTLWDE